ncbi:class I SAM-dependent methyltransferase [Aquipuribacter sp. SD81]|uniref:class I SAM-dependent methyltransferase n=1 Tax=Aquipuribacter sp. SD81 TaxID=3127703 RepID=UPI00301B673E
MSGAHGGRTALPLTGERTGPDDGTAAWREHERYWFDRHVAGYSLAARLLGHRPDALVLDTGSGEGYGAASLRAVTGARLVGVELDPAATAHARDRYRLAAVRANVVALPLASGSVDAVVSSQVLEHVWTPHEHLGEARRVLRPGGLLVCSTPNRLTFSPGLHRGEPPRNLYHSREYDAGELLDLAASTGLAAAQVLGVHGPDLSVVGAPAGPAGFRAAPDGPAAPLDACLDLVLVARRPR